jgi:hypothetical protein
MNSTTSAWRGVRGFKTYVHGSRRLRSVVCEFLMLAAGRLSSAGPGREVELWAAALVASSMRANSWRVPAVRKAHRRKGAAKWAGASGRIWRELEVVGEKRVAAFPPGSAGWCAPKRGWLAEGWFWRGRNRRKWARGTGVVGAGWGCVLAARGVRLAWRNDEKGSRGGSAFSALKLTNASKKDL